MLMNEVTFSAVAVVPVEVTATYTELSFQTV